MQNEEFENIKDIQESFLSYLKDFRKMKDSTINSYISDLNAFLSYCKIKKVKTLSKMCDFFESYISNLEKNSKSNATILRNVYSLKVFFKFVREKGLITENPAENFKSTNYSPQISTDVLTYDEIDKLIGICSKDTIKGIRDCAIIETMYACGLKVTEIINLKTDDLFLSDGYIILHEEDFQRYIPIYKGAVKSINSYIKNARPSLTCDRKNKILFLNLDGMQISRQGLWKILKSCGKNAGIDKEITPQIIRHSMAVHLMENGAGLSDIQNILGHKNIHLTKNYVKDIKPSIISRYEKTHPKA